MVRLVLTSMALALSLATAAHACSCAARAESPEAMALRIAEPTFILFDARVLRVAYSRTADAEIISSAATGATTFEVVYDWLGRLDGRTELTITHRLHASACGVMFEPDAEVLVIAWRMDADRLVINTCIMPRADSWALWRRVAFMQMRQRPDGADRP